MALTLAQLRTEIEDYLVAHPDHWDTVVDIARDSEPEIDPKNRLPENATLFEDTAEWYTRTQEDGKHHLVLSGDDPSSRLIGFHIVTVHGDELGAYYIPLPKLKEQMDELGEAVTNYLRTPKGRTELGAMLGKGTAPTLSP